MLKMDKVKVKEEESSDEETTETDEEKLFFSGPFKDKYSIDNYEYSSNINSECSTLMFESSTDKKEVLTTKEQKDSSSLPTSQLGHFVSGGTDCRYLKMSYGNDESSDDLTSDDGELNMILVWSDESSKESVLNYGNCDLTLASDDEPAEGTSETSKSTKPGSDRLFSQDSKVSLIQKSSEKLKRKFVPEDKERKTGLKKNLDAQPQEVSKRKKMKSGCHEKCKVCTKDGRLSEDERKILFDKFQQIGDPTSQWDFIAANVGEEVPKKKFVKGDKGRSSTRSYSFEISTNKRVRVCKKMFLDTLAINGAVVDTALKKKTPDGSCKPDARGRHLNRPKRTKEETDQSVRDHIMSFPTVLSRYTWEDTDRKFLANGLSVDKMYAMYLEYAREKKVRRPASHRIYREIFVRKFNYGFFMPKVDKIKCTSIKEDVIRGDHDAENSTKDKNEQGDNLL